MTKYNKFEKFGTYICQLATMETTAILTNFSLPAPTTDRLNVVVWSRPRYGMAEMVRQLPEGFNLGQLPPWTDVFCPRCPLSGHRAAAFPIDRLSTNQVSPLCRLLILLLLLMGGNIHPNPGPNFPCAVCAGPVTWRHKSIQCVTCSLWVHLRCSGITLTRFRSMSATHSWSCPVCVGPSTMHQSSPASSSPACNLNPSSLSTPSRTIMPTSPHTYAGNSLPLANPPPLITTYPTTALGVPPPPSQPTNPALTAQPFSIPASSANCLRILQWNAGGIRSRRTEFLHFLSENQYDLIFVQETHLSLGTPFRVPGFSVLRSDRTMARSGPTNPNRALGGGVLILIRNGLSFSKLSTDSLARLDPNSDYLAITVNVKGAPALHFFNIYSPPIRTSPTDSRTRSFSPHILPSSPSTFILGDFNCHHPSWDPSGLEDHLGRELYDWMLSSELLPLNDSQTPTLLHRPTGSRTSPDLSIVPASISSRCTWGVLPDLGSDHLPIHICVPIAPVINSISRPPSFNYGKARWADYQSYLEDNCLPLSSFGSLSLSEANHYFSLLILDAAKVAIPFGSINRSAKAWWSPEVAVAVAKRRQLFARAHRSEADRQAYIAHSRYTSTVISKAKTESWQKTCSSLSPKTRPSAVFSLLRSITGNPTSPGDLPDFPGTITPIDCANRLSSYMQGHFSSPTPKHARHEERGYLNKLRSSQCSSTSSHDTFCSPFSQHELSSALSQLSSSTACGPDKVSYPLLTHLPQAGKDLLLHIFNLSWSTHSFPSAWKQSTIIPILKSGKPSNSPSSYRPISLTSCISKLFERMVLARLSFFLEANNILTNVQAGFRAGRSTVDQVLLLSQSISDGFHQRKPASRTILATVDFAKAFDSVWHSALLSKLLSLGLPPCFVRWTRSFLSDRRSKVRVKNSLSHSFRVRRGVPQGSVLGPVLFSLFINDLPATLPSSVNVSLYADDLAIWSSSPLIDQASQAVQSALDCLADWSKRWQLPLNPLKCESSFFSTDPHQSRYRPNLTILDTPLNFNPTPTFLGVTFDRTLSFKDHILSLRKKFYPRLKALRSIASSSWGPTKESLALLYKAFIRPVLTYASPGWYPFTSQTHCNTLERMHNSSCRVISGCLSSTRVDLLLLESLLPPLSVSLTHQSLSFYERAVRLPGSFPVSSLAKRSYRTRLKKKSSWRSFCQNHSLIPDPQTIREPLTFLSTAPWSDAPRYSISTTLSEPCSRTDPPGVRYDAAISHISTLSPADVTAWTDGSVPNGLGRGGAGAHIHCNLCSSTVSLSYTTGASASSFTAETHAINRALDWCLSHQSLCSYKSLLLFSDSKSVLMTLADPPSYLIPQSLADTQQKLTTLSESKDIHFQWIPGHSSLPGNDLADNLAKTGATLSTTDVPLSYSPLISSIRLSLYSTWRNSISSKFFDHRVPAVSPEELSLPRSARCALSRLRCNGHSPLLASYLHRIGKAETPSCSACGSTTQDTTHLVLNCPALDSLRMAIFGHTNNITDLWSRPWGVARMLGLRGVPPCPHP